MPQTASDPILDLRPGEFVRVRDRAEIFATLDESGTLDGMPFMPEMLQYCGRTFSVAQRADRTCAGDGVVRRMDAAVHLAGLRCDGASHGGCQAACLLYWKEAWLERVEGGKAPAPRGPDAAENAYVTGVLLPMTKRPRPSPQAAPIYRCQATEIPAAAGSPWRMRELGQLAGDVRDWNLWKVVRGLVVELFNVWQDFSANHLPRALRIADGRRHPFFMGSLKKGETPTETLDLRPGELVRIKSKEEIISTLDETNHNRGLSFDGEMARHCGKVARVRGRVDRLIDEKTGEMIEIKSDCIILEATRSP
jgi:hypothetical protein